MRDLRERWMDYADPIERHQKSRSFFGRLAELQCAEWLASQGWTVSGLEALRQGPDIEAYARDGRFTAFEVKFIGMEDADFGVMRKSLVGQPAGGPVSPDAAANDLLFRADQAAKPLQRMTCGRIAVLAVDEWTWSRCTVQRRANWIDWAHPPCFPGDPGWEEFFARQQPQYPARPAELQPVLGSLTAVWILRRAYGYTYDRKPGQDIVYASGE